MKKKFLNRELIVPITAILIAGVLFSFSTISKPVPNIAPHDIIGEQAAIALPHKLPVPPDGISARSYVIRIIGEKTPIMVHNADTPTAPASLVKILTALLSAELLPQAEWIEISKSAKEIEPKISSVPAGEAFLRDDAIRYIAVESANDIAIALAERIGRYAGGKTADEAIATFVALMNEKANSLGLKNTYIRNPTGLDAPRQLTTANDISRLAEYSWADNPTLWNMSRTIEAVITSRERKEYRIRNTNKLLTEFPGILGGKTGFTDEARENLILIYPVRPASVAVIVLMGSDDRTKDGRIMLRWIEENIN